MERKHFLNVAFWSFLSLALNLWLPTQATAQEFVLGAQVGGVGANESVGTSSSSGVAYGPFLRINPLGWAAFQVDATFASLSGARYFSSSPGLYIYPYASDDYSVGMIFGPGFYSLPNQSIKFGLHLGIGGSFSVAKNFSIGTEARYHSVLQSMDAWSVLVNVGYRFEASNDW